MATGAATAFPAPSKPPPARHPPCMPPARHHKRDGDFAALSQQLADYYQAHKAELPEAFIWRDSTPQHFDIENGEFPHPDEASQKLAWPFKCVPIQVGACFGGVGGGAWWARALGERGGVGRARASWEGSPARMAHHLPSPSHQGCRVAGPARGSIAGPGHGWLNCNVC